MVIRFSHLPFSLAQELIATYGSPLYVYSGDRLRQTIRHITCAIPYPQAQFRFASVTNGNLSLLRIFQQEGWGLHANTPGDAYLGLHAGFHPSQIVYSGSNLNRTEMAQILQWGITTLNLDSLSQLQLLCDIWTDLIANRQDSDRTLFNTNQQSPSKTVLQTLGAGLSDQLLNQERSVKPAPTSPATRHPTLDTHPLSPNTHPLPPTIGLRLNYPPLTGDSRIGVRPEEFADAVAIAHQAGLKISGLHFYRGTGTNATKAFTQVIEQVLAIAQQLPDWKYLDFGGGFGYPYQHGGAAFDWEEFGSTLTIALQQLDRSIALIIEPGRAAIAGCAVLLTQVVSVKWQENKQIIGTDTTVANLSVPSVHGGYREIVAIGVNDSEPYQTDVCGNTTYSRDYLGKNCQLPAVKVGDILAVLDVGAYGYAMSSHFLHRLRPAEILLENGNHRLIRKRDSYDILLANQVFEGSINK